MRLFVVSILRASSGLIFIEDCSMLRFADATHILGSDGSPISVYRVSIDIEEAKAVAAHYLTFKDRQSIEMVSALRIDLRDYEDIGISVQETSENTGAGAIE